MNPYEILGVSESADEETIKKAYRELVKKYHPDKYINNPLADLAAEKMKQINEAYDIITSGRTSGSGASRASGSRSSSTGYSQTNSYRSAPSFQAVRSYIQQRSFSAAETMLAQLPRTAEWYYLSGVLKLNRGWYTEAHNDLRRAVQMDPSNAEYSATLNSLNNMSNGYRVNNGYGTYGGTDNSACGCLPGMDTCSCCSNLICADCCCECMGGDLIPCC